MKTGRQHDYFSSHEFHYHFILDWGKLVNDIQEQFPLLPLEQTIGIAEQLGIRHPSAGNPHEPIVMTTDFLITLQRPIGVIKVARTIKPAKELEDKRTIEKFEIERRFWLARGIHWAIVTENEIDLVLVEKIKWVHKFFQTSSLAPLSQQEIRKIAIALTQMLLDSTEPLSTVALACDQKLSLTLGQSLAVARHLIASRQWHVNMSKPGHLLDSKLELLGTSLNESDRKRRRG
ncbi:MAG TPA: TnsA endonuclease N-terminal domain-containing protein [Pyrinomonadaceae bacterium]|nr:TnsA endonuclease N-terminal domain-containing protein [Pyrinomonadaceae bacterium]